jgi:hypothetical protein
LGRIIRPFASLMTGVAVWMLWRVMKRDRGFLLPHLVFLFSGSALIAAASVLIRSDIADAIA